VPEYTLSPLDHVLLAWFRRALLKELKCEDTYEKGFAGVARLVELLHRRSSCADETQRRGTRVLRSLLPRPFTRAFGAFLSVLPDWFVARHASATTVLVLNWLVGPSEVNDAPANLLPENKSRPPSNAAAAAVRQGTEACGYRQGVLVKRCRILEETKCASVCLNVCQVPTQRFFTEDIGLPMTMLPNYDNFECQFVFGRYPPPPAESDIFVTPCFKQCPSASARAKLCDLKPYVPETESSDSGKADSLDEQANQ